MLLSGNAKLLQENANALKFVFRNVVFFPSQCPFRGSICIKIPKKTKKTNKNLFFLRLNIKIVGSLL